MIVNRADIVRAVYNQVRSIRKEIMDKLILKANRKSEEQFMEWAEMAGANIERLGYRRYYFK